MMTLEHEAVILSRYLIRRPPSRQVVDLYSDAIRVLNLTLTRRETNVWNFALKHPWCISLMDAGLALNLTHSVLRRRILVMLAILETQVEYHSFFLPTSRPAIYMLVIPYLLAKSTLKLIAGKVFVWLSSQK